MPDLQVLEDAVDPATEGWLRRALRAEEAALPVRIRAADLEIRWGRRATERRRNPWPAALAAGVALVLVGAFAFSRLAVGPSPTISASAGAVITAEPLPRGLSAGTATLALTSPTRSTQRLALKCTWSASGRVVGMAIEAPRVGDAPLQLRWRSAPGGSVRLTIEDANGGDSAVQSLSSDARTGTIGIDRWTMGSTPIAGTFRWDCGSAPSPAATPSLPAGGADGVPALWLVGGGTAPISTAFACPAHLDVPGAGREASCASAELWVDAVPQESAGAGALHVAISGWTISRTSVAWTSPTGADLDRRYRESVGPDMVGPQPSFEIPAGDWLVRIDVEAARDDGSWLQASYALRLHVG